MEKFYYLSNENSCLKSISLGEFIFSVKYEHKNDNLGYCYYEYISVWDNEIIIRLRKVSSEEKKNKYSFAYWDSIDDIWISQDITEEIIKFIDLIITNTNSII